MLQMQGVRRREHMRARQGMRRCEEGHVSLPVTHPLLRGGARLLASHTSIAADSIRVGADNAMCMARVQNYIYHDGMRGPTAADNNGDRPRTELDLGWALDRYMHQEWRQKGL
jgi:hypothetical protein